MSAKRILAVENDALVLSFLEAALIGTGYEVDTAGNGREALEKIDREAYHLIISDLRMPELDGPSLWRTLQQRGSDAVRRFLFLTSPDARDDHRAFLREAGVPALTKPVALDELRYAAKSMIETLERREAAVALGARF